jgi:hypothetical protein
VVRKDITYLYTDTEEIELSEYDGCKKFSMLHKGMKNKKMSILCGSNSG